MLAAPAPGQQQLIGPNYAERHLRELLQHINFVDTARTNMKIRFIKSSSNMTDHISEIHLLLNEKGIKYKSYYYNNNLFQKESKKDDEEIKIVNYNSPENWYEFIEENIEYVFLGAWNFKEEIFKKEKKFIKRGGKFIIHTPLPRIV